MSITGKTYWRGFRDGAPFILVIAPFGLLFGVVATEAGFTLLGALAGSAIPDEYALDFAIPITFLAMVAPALRSLPHVAAAIVSVVVALALSWMPYNLWLMIAAVLAMMTGARIEKWQEART